VPPTFTAIIRNAVRMISRGWRDLSRRRSAGGHHRLPVHCQQERKRTYALKAQKDLEQSFDLQTVLKKLDPESLAEAFEDARSMGPGWKRRVDAGQKTMRRLFA